jgi:hypothetical protein
MKEVLFCPNGKYELTNIAICMREPAPVGTKCGHTPCANIAIRQFIDSNAVKKGTLIIHPLCGDCEKHHILPIHFDEGDLFDAIELMSEKKGC